VAWIWSDDLAAAAEAAGVEHAELTAWKHRPVAFASASDRATPALARQLLGLAPVVEHADREASFPCSCAAHPGAILAGRAADG
jgi:hypothetical protein